MTVVNTPAIAEVKKDTLKKDKIYSEAMSWMDTTPFPANPWRTKVGWEIQDTNAMNILKKIFPAYWFHTYDSTLLGYWKCDKCKPVKYIDVNYMDNLSEYEIDSFLPESNFYFTMLLGTKKFIWKNKWHWMLAFNTSTDPNGAGHFVGGRLGMLIFEKDIKNSWKLINYDPIIGGYGSWQKSPMPELGIINDTTIYFSVETSSCGAGGPCYDDIYIFSPTKIGFSNHYHIDECGYMPQSPLPPYWNSTISYGANINIVTEGEFATTDNENFRQPKILVKEYKNRKNKPFKFIWNRSYLFKENHWELVSEKLNIK